MLRGITLIDVGVDVDAGVVRAKQLKEIVSLTPWMIVGALLNCSILMLHFWLAEQSFAVMVWGAAIWLFAMLTLLKWYRARHRPPIVSASKRSVFRAVRHASILGALWGCLPLITMGAGEDMDRAVVIITIVGMSASGSFVLAVLPAAALAHLSVMLLPTLLATSVGLMTASVTLTILIVNYFVVLTIIIMARYREFVYRLRDHQQIESQSTALAARTEEARRAAESATEASRAKSQFLASMSHEIRTPMNGVFGMADLLSRTELTPQQQRLVATINQSATSLLTIINDLLDLSRIEAGKLELDPQDFNLRDCVEGVIESFSQDAQRKGLDLNLMIPLSVPLAVKGDAGRLRQVLTNLVGNAMKFTRQGAITVRVEHLGLHGCEHKLRISVADTGIGIVPASKALLFKPFVQADSSITRRFGGTGLGLSISQHLVRMMGGDISLESEMGKGTTVTFTVVLSEGQLPDAQQPIAPSAIRGERVLIVDDKETNREIVSSYLADCGALTETVATAPEALEQLRAAAAEGRPFVLAALDMILPGMNGLELAKRIKADPSISATRTVMVTSLSWEADCKTAREAGIDEFLSKPVRRGELLDAVRRCFKARPGNLNLDDPVAPSIAVPALESFPGMRLLVAEDNLVNQEVIREYASQLGCVIEIADNGQIAVDAFCKGTFDVVLMDCQMPELNGLAACRKIRQFEQDRGVARTPVIAITANAYASDRAMCMAAEMDDFISKPFTAKQLADMLSKWTRRMAMRRAVPAAVTSRTEETKQPPKLATLDVGQLTDFESRKPGMAARLIDLYLSTAPTSVKQIMAAIVHGEHDKIRDAAHSLRSASANIGAKELARLAERLEAQARDGEPMPSCLMQAAQLEAELRALEAMLSRSDWIISRQRAS